MKKRPKGVRFPAPRLPSEKKIVKLAKSIFPGGREAGGIKRHTIFEGVDQKHEQSASAEFGEELAGSREEGLGVCAEDAGGGVVGVARNGADAGAAFVLVDCGFVVCVDD